MYSQAPRFRMAWRKPWQIQTANPIKEALLQIEATSPDSVACTIQVLGTFEHYTAYLHRLEAFSKDARCTLRAHEADDSTEAIHRSETFNSSRIRTA